MLTAIVRLHDVDDVLGFVNATINDFTRGRPGKPGVHLSADEREELVAEGLCIMYDLADKFRVRLDGYEQDGRFSGFAAMFLPRKLGDAWHAMHEEHRLVSDPETGKRTWVYHDKHTSYEQVVEVSNATTDVSGGLRARGGVHESDVRHLRDFAPLPLPARSRAHDEGASAGGLAQAA